MINNSLFSILERIFSAGLKFLTVFLLGHWLGPEGQGVFSLYLVIWAWAGILSSLGLGIANNYFGAEHPSSNSVSKLLGNSLIFSTASGLLTASVIWFLAFFTDLFRALPENQIPTLLGGVFLHAISVPLLGLLLGIGEFKTRVVSTLLSYVFFISLIFYRQGYGIISVLTLGSDWLIATALGILIWIFKCLERSSFKISWDKHLLREQIVFGSKSYKYLLTNSALIRIDVILVSYILGAGATGIYSIALYFAEILLYFPSALTTVILTAVGGKERVKIDFYRYISTFFLLAILGTTLIIPIAVNIFFPPQYSEAIILAEFMLFGVYWLGMGSVAVYHMFGYKDATQPFKMSLIAIILEFGLAFLLIPSFGLLGAAFASTLAYTFFGITIIKHLAKTYSCKIIDLIAPLHPVTLAKNLIISYAHKNHK